MASLDDSEAPGQCVVFIDAPDPDNFMLVVGAVLQRNARHVVVTGRPANLDVKSRPFHPRTCARPADEVDQPGDGELILHANVEHLRRFCDDHGALVDVLFYDGGCAPDAPVAHAEHVHEFLFGRGDLAGARGFGMTRAGGVDAKGYAGLVKELDAADPGKRGETCRGWLQSEVARGKPLAPLEILGRATRGAPVDVLVGGPFTAFDALARHDEEWAASIRSVHAMAGAWDCSTANLFKNQFNCGADLRAAFHLLGPASPLLCPVALYTTEFCKRAMVLTPAEVREHASPAAADLYDLWHELTGRRGSVCIFDVAPLLGASQPLASMVPVTCDLVADDVFRLKRAEQSRIAATAPELSVEAAVVAKNALLAMLEKCAAIAKAL